MRPGLRPNRVLTASPAQHRGTFGGVDWTVVGLYFLTVVGISAYVARKMKASTDDFFLGGQSIPWWAAGLSYQHCPAGPGLGIELDWDWLDWDWLDNHTVELIQGSSY